MTDQTISHSGLALIQNFEGCKLVAYQDSTGVWTIGYGHTSGAGAPLVHAGMHITQPEAEVILSNDLEKFEAIVRKHVTQPLTQHEFDALVSFVYNLGEGNFAKSTLLRMVNAGNMAGAKTQFARWTRAGGVVLQGLVRRRAAEASLFAAPDTPGAAAQAPAKPPVAEDGAEAPKLAPKPPTGPADPVADILSPLASIVTDTVGSALSPAGPLPGASDPSPAADESNIMNALSILAGLFGGVSGKIGVASTVMTELPHLVEGTIANVSELPKVKADIDELVADIKGGRWAETPNDLHALIAEFGVILKNYGVSLPALTTMVDKLPAAPAIAKAA